jgi:CRISPR-associated protein Cas1
VAADPIRSGVIAAALVAGKIRNCRTMLRRNAQGIGATELGRMRELAIAAEGSSDPATLLGVEGTAARIYFGAFGRLSSQ